MMKRIVATLFFLSLLLIAAALLAPSFIDWNAHKGQIISRIQPYFDSKIDVAGDVGFRILPNPQILLGDVTFANAEGAKAPAFMKLKRLEASMKLEPLLEGRFEVDNVNLVQPELNLEVLKGGDANWSAVLKKSDKAPGDALGATADSVQLNQVTMTGGTLHYANDNTGSAFEVDNVNLTVGADTLLGPYRATGTMQYRNYVVNVDVGTGRYDNGSPVPLHVTFIPVEGLPQVKLNGVVDVKSGLDMQCDLDIQNGSLASLFDSSFLNSIAFMNDTADVNASLDFKGGSATLTAIKARFGQIKDGKAAGGELSGSISAKLSHDANTSVIADLKGSYLNVSTKGGLMQTPTGFDAHLKLSGKHIVWDGVDMTGVNMTADSDKGEWTIKEARFDMPGHSVAKLAGVITPKNDYAAYSMQLTTDDLTRFMTALAPAKGNILSVLTTAPLVHKLNLESSLDVKGDKISIFDIDGMADDKTKISGVLNVGRAAEARPSFEAHLNLSGLNVDALPDDAVHDAVNAIMGSNGTMDISGSDIVDAGLKMDSLTFKGKTADTGLAITALDAKLSDGGNIHVDGSLANVHPAKGININYAVKTAKLSNVLNAAGMDMLPLFTAADAVDVKGTLKGDAGEPHITLSGTTGANNVSLDGVLHQSPDHPDAYEGTVHMANATGANAWASLGLPVDRLIGRAGAFDLSGALSGSAKSFKLDGLKVKQADDDISGNLALDDGKFQGKLSVGTIDIDNWVKGDWPVKQPVDLQLTGKKMFLRGYDISNPQLDLQADTTTLKTADLKGSLMGGDLEANISSEKQVTGWKSIISGTLKNANLPQAVTGLGIDSGVTLARGDVGFDLAATGTGTDANLEDLSGKLTVSSQEMTLKDFNLSGLAPLIAAQATPPAFLSDMLRKSLRAHGDSVYKNVTATLKLAGGKINIDQMDMSNADAALKVKGSYDPKPRHYELTATTHLTHPADMPEFTISRSGIMKSSADNIVEVKPIADYITQHAPKPAPAQTPETVKTPTAVETHAAADQLSQPPLPENAAPLTMPQTGAPQVNMPPETGGLDNAAPIEAEPLPAPAVTPTEQAPATGDTKKPADTNASGAKTPDTTPKNDESIKGVLDRLNDSP